MSPPDPSIANQLRNISRADRSKPRERRRKGDTSIDARGRNLSVPAILSYGFRPFFFLAALHAALFVPFWVWAHQAGYVLSGPFHGPGWHAHEMIFGFLSAIIAGFILTAVPNWTGRLPLSGWRLAVLVAFWVAGRIAVGSMSHPWGALSFDMLFPLLLSFAIWREVLAGRNWRNAPIAVLITLFASASLLHHWEEMNGTDDGFAIRLALGVSSMLIALIGGRIVPSFTRNWLVKRGEARLPEPFGTVDKATLVLTVLAVLSWILFPTHGASGWLLLGAGAMLGVRLARWRGWGTWREPIVLILHLGYLWLAVALAMLGLAILVPEQVPYDAALHALTAGAIGTMVLAVMTRASLGHTGHIIATNTATVLIYALATLGALLRIAVPLMPDHYAHLLYAAGGTWALAFGLFALRYGPILWSPRHSA